MGLEEDRAFDGHDFLKPHDHRTESRQFDSWSFVENLSGAWKSTFLVSGIVAMAFTQAGLKVWHSFWDKMTSFLQQITIEMIPER